MGAKSVGELAADGHPFGGLKVVVLEEEHQRGGAEEGGVLAMELGLAELGRTVGWRLSGRIA